MGNVLFTNPPYPPADPAELEPLNLAPGNGDGRLTDGGLLVRDNAPF